MSTRVFASAVADDMKDFVGGLSNSERRDLEILLRRPAAGKDESLPSAK